MIPMLMGLLYTWDDKASVNSSRSFSKFVSLEASQTNQETPSLSHGTIKVITLLSLEIASQLQTMCRTN